MWLIIYNTDSLGLLVTLKLTFLLFSIGGYVQLLSRNKNCSHLWDYLALNVAFSCVGYHANHTNYYHRQSRWFYLRLYYYSAGSFALEIIRNRKNPSLLTI